VDKLAASLDEAVADIRNGSTILVGGFGGAGRPEALVVALARRGLKDLTIIANNAQFGELGRLGAIRKLICTYPVAPGARDFLERIEAGEVEVELMPQGTFTERLRAGGSGLGGVLTPVGIGTELAHGYQQVEVNNRPYLIAPALRGDFAFVHASVGDRWGNLFHRHASRNFNPIMAMAADVTIAQCERVVEPGELDPDHVHTPGAFVTRVVECAPDRAAPVA
jgi:3-oxoacid CoA-transferase A subunit